MYLFHVPVCYCKKFSGRSFFCVNPLQTLRTYSVKICTFDILLFSGFYKTHPQTSILAGSLLAFPVTTVFILLSPLQGRGASSLWGEPEHAAHCRFYSLLYITHKQCSVLYCFTLYIQTTQYFILLQSHCTFKQHSTALLSLPHTFFTLWNEPGHAAAPHCWFHSLPWQQCMFALKVPSRLLTCTGEGLGSKLRHGPEMMDLVSTNRAHITY